MEPASMASSSAISISGSPLQLRVRCVAPQPLICDGKRRRGSWSQVVVLWAYSPCLRTSGRGMARWDLFRARCSTASSTNTTAETGQAGTSVDGDNGGVVKAAREGGEGAGLWNVLSRMEGTVSSLPPIVYAIKGRTSSKFAIGFFLAFAFLVIVVRQTITRKPRYSPQGSVADLVKRGQLKSHSRGMSRPLKYEDPFNNPLVKISKSNSTIEMCGKVYQLAPVTLTEEQQSSHQKRRSRAYTWKRPTVFLKEGDDMPPDVDPDTVRWIPANHPFATTVSDIDEELAQSNVYQKNGVPFRIKAEHEALQKKLEALQRDQKLNKVSINPNNIHEFERAFKASPDTQDGLEPRLAADKRYDLVADPKSDPALDPSVGDASEERKKS
ncbi:hypothetical protein Taro_053726 [Colocasia esculenta]|uniref:Protein MULTIPLE CHLOROPLAST DIVISION SITE 1 n=1 Tax=Colocasia esculenta TaxID=4460 RepID=A0A843XNF4_COLES|nr:hypothetical protein [Colocasia esculenta]